MGTGDDPTGASIFTLPERPGARREGTSARDEAERLPPGARLGRYVVTGFVGAGGMGVVYAARDPDLDRNVALKVLRPELSVEIRSRSRLIGEARAMAQLSHPNVVPVYDVGVLDDQVFIAMELIEGVTLRRKLDRNTPWRTVIQAYLQAARGLAAAHAAGLVHRDFKPDNVLFGADGRIRVVDFGLVAVDPLEPAPPGSPLRSDLSPHVETTVGVVLGTPAFMAPEAMRGEPTDARADQFSFCVALFHALYGVYPHSGATLADRAEHIQRGAIARPAGSVVPARFYRILTRGLRADPDDRWPSMEALAQALEQAARVRRRGRTMALAGLAGALVAAALAFFLLRVRAKEPFFGPPVTVGRSDDPRVSISMLPDGRYLHVEHDTVSLLSSDGQHARTLVAPPNTKPVRARAGAPGWAKVFSLGAPCMWWLVPVDGTAPWTRLYMDPLCASEIDVSPDGTQIAVSTAGDLLVQNLATGEQRTLMHKPYGVTADDTYSPAWSPDGKRIAIDGELTVVNAATGAVEFHGRNAGSPQWLDVNRVLYSSRSWLRSEVHVLDLRTKADEVVLELEGNVLDLSSRAGGVLLRRDEIHSRAYITSTNPPTPRAVDDLTPLDTGSTIDFRPATWSNDGAVITLAMVAGQRGLVRTVPGQRGAALTLDRARNVTMFGTQASTAQQILYILNDSHGCQSRIYDLDTNRVLPWPDVACLPRPFISCARTRCIVASDDRGARWFDPATQRFGGPAPQMDRDESLSPDEAASARTVGGAIQIRDLVNSSADGPVSITPPVSGAFSVGWGADSRTLIVTTDPNQLEHRRLLIGRGDWHTGTLDWQLVIDEPHRQLNGYAVSPDGSQLALVALLTTSTWGFYPFTSPSSN